MKKKRCLQQRKTETENLSRLQLLGTDLVVTADVGGFDLWSQPQGPKVFSKCMSVCRTALPDRKHTTYGTETGKETQMERLTEKKQSPKRDIIASKFITACQNPKPWGRRLMSHLLNH